MENRPKFKLPEGAIPYPEAIANAFRWKDLAIAKLGADKVYSFKVPMIDFKSVLHEDAKSIRCSLAEKPDGSKQLLVLGIDADGKDMIDYDNGMYIYDFTTPCPPSCDPMSPLPK